jgi:hypothetical protein
MHRSGRLPAARAGVAPVVGVAATRAARLLESGVQLWSFMQGDMMVRLLPATIRRRYAEVAVLVRVHHGRHGVTPEPAHATPAFAPEAGQPVRNLRGLVVVVEGLWWLVRWYQRWLALARGTRSSGDSPYRS